MKIMQIIPYFCFGGAETMCENLTYALGSMGHTVCVVSLFSERTPIARRMEAAGVPIRYLDKKPGLDLSMIPRLTKLMKQERPDAVHTHLNVIKYAAAAAHFAKVPVCVHTVHNVADKEAEGRLQKILNKFYFSQGWSLPVALSPEVLRSISEFYRRPREETPVVFNGVDLSKCQPKEDYTLGETAVLTHIGRFNEQKNHEGLLRAFALVLARYPRCRLDLIGDGERLEEMKGLTQELGIAGSVRFLGSQVNVHPFLSRSDVFLLPSHYEGMPMTLIEAMGTALPIAASAVGGVPDMLQNEESGLLTSAEPENVARAVLRLLEDQGLREKLGRNALTASRRFSAQTMAESYARLYAGEGE